MRSTSPFFAACAAVALAGGLCIQCDFETGAEGGPASSTPPATVKDASASGDASVSTDGICTRAGGKSALQKIADDTVAAVAADCRISLPFTRLNVEQVAHVRDCLGNQLADVTKCEGAPAYAGSKDSKGQVCRNMLQAHQRISISLADFDAFMTDMVGVLNKNGIEGKDVDALVGALRREQTNIARSQKTTFTRQCDEPEPVIDAGVDAAIDGAIVDAARDVQNDTGTVQDSGDPADTGTGGDSAAPDDSGTD